jgi:hypothetical protein
MALHCFCQISSDNPRLRFAPPPLSIPPPTPTIKSPTLRVEDAINAYPAPNIPPAPLMSVSGPTTTHSGTGTPVRRGNKRMIRSRPLGDVADTNTAKEVADVGCLCKKAMPARRSLNETITRNQMRGAHLDLLHQNPFPGATSPTCRKAIAPRSWSRREQHPQTYFLFHPVSPDCYPQYALLQTS